MSSDLHSPTEGRAPRRRVWLGRAVFAGLATLLITIYLAPDIFIPVRAGEAGVLWRRFWGGTELGRVYGEGTVAILPWDELYIYDLTVQHVRTKTAVYSSDGLALEVTVSGRFRVERARLPRLHAEVGPAYKAKLVEPELLASVRAVFGRYCAEVVYASGELALLPALHEDFAARLARYGLVEADLQLERVELPRDVRAAIEQKLASAEAVQRERHEKERRVLQAEGLAAFARITGVSIERWGAIEATSELARSPNAKVIVIGNDRKSLPVILNAELDDPPAAPAPAAARAPARPAAAPPAP